MQTMTKQWVTDGCLCIFMGCLCLHPSRYLCTVYLMCWVKCNLFRSATQYIDLLKLNWKLSCVLKQKWIIYFLYEHVLQGGMAQMAVTAKLGMRSGVIGNGQPSRALGSKPSPPENLVSFSFSARQRAVGRRIMGCRSVREVIPQPLQSAELV